MSADPSSAIGRRCLAPECAQIHLCPEPIADCSCSSCGGDRVETLGPDLEPYWGPGWNPSPNSDGFRLHAIDLDRYAGYAEGLEDMPTIDDLNRLAASRERQRLDQQRGSGM